jgi:hypothetical protein
MHRTQNRLLLTVTAGIAALALGAGPALAGSDGCAGGDCRDEAAPAPIVPVAPAPVTPLSSQESDSEHASAAPSRRVRARRRTVPRGAVAAGAGGMARSDADGVLALLAGGGAVLLAAGGGLVASGRRGVS